MKTNFINTSIIINWNAPSDPKIKGGVRGLAVVPPAPNDLKCDRAEILTHVSVNEIAKMPCVEI